MGVAELLAHGGPRQQLRGRDQPTHAQAGAEHLAQAAAVGQPLAAAGHTLAQGQQAGRWWSAKVQVAIGVVLDHQDLVAHGQFQNFQPTLQAEHGPTGVAKGGHQVNQLGLVFDHQRLERFHVHALSVDGGTDHARAIQAKALDGRQKSGGLHNHRVLRIEHGFANQVQRLLTAGGDDQSLRTQSRHAFAGHELAQLFAQRGITFCGAVLQGRSRLMGQDMLAGMLDALDVKHRAVGKAARKADDAGLAQQLEQLTDRGGFNVVQALCKLHGRIHQRKLIGI